jgi:hypothetical protein
VNYKRFFESGHELDKSILIYISQFKTIFFFIKTILKAKNMLFQRKTTCISLKF